MQIRDLSPDEWPVYRTLRLRALAGAPDAYTELLEEAEARPDEDWAATMQDWLARGARVYLVAEDEGGPRGGIVVTRETDAEAAGISAVWVDPEARRGGLARQLVEHAIAWAVERGATRVYLHVTEGNAGAIRLYEQLGFSLTGEWVPLRTGSPLRSLGMVKRLG